MVFRLCIVAYKGFKGAYTAFKLRKNPKTSDTENIAIVILKLGQKHAVGIANSVDPDQTAPLGAVWSGSALFAKTCLSEKLGSLRF